MVVTDVAVSKRVLFRWKNVEDMLQIVLKRDLYDRVFTSRKMTQFPLCAWKGMTLVHNKRKKIEPRIKFNHVICDTLSFWAPNGSNSLLAFTILPLLMQNADEHSHAFVTRPVELISQCWTT